MILICIILIFLAFNYWKNSVVDITSTQFHQNNDASVISDTIFNESAVDGTVRNVFNAGGVFTIQNSTESFAVSNPYFQIFHEPRTSFKLSDLSTVTPSIAWTAKMKMPNDKSEVADTGQEIIDDKTIRNTAKKSPSDFTSEDLVRKTSDENKLSSRALKSNNELHRIQELLLAKAIAKTHVRLPHQPRRVRGPWQMVEDQHEIYLLSAYYDDRPTLDRSCVTVIAVAEPAADQIFCLFWYDTQNQPEVRRAEIISVGPQMAPGGKTWYEQYLFSCTLPDAFLSTPPTNVSIVTPHNVRPSTLLPVQIPVKPNSSKELVEFGHCMSILYWKHDPYKVVEWLELHRMWGVGEVSIYGHELDNHTKSVLEYYAREGFVVYQTIPTVIDEADELTILLNMSPVINDCMYRNMYRYKYVLCTDIDEMIVPHGTLRTYSAMLKAIETSRFSNTSQPPSHPVYSYLFRNAYFFLDFGPVADEPWWSMTQRYTRRIAPSRYGYSAKSITRTLDCLGLQNHLCWRHAHKSISVDDWNFDVSVLHGLNHHYKKCHFDRYLGKDGECLRLLMHPNVDSSLKRFTSVLSRRVIAKLKELDLVEETYL